LHLQARGLFESLGGELQVCPALNTNDWFIAAIRDLVVRGPRPIVTWNRGHEPLLRSSGPQAPANLGLDRLVMIGVSLANRLGSGRGPQLAYSDAEGLACAKKPHHEVESFLEGLKSEAHINDAFVWNTCFRFECYAWLESPAPHARRDCVVNALRNRLFASRPEGVRINTLFGRSAWHHLIRTIAGLNSGLPGDKDIVEQFRTAYRAAERAGTAGPHAQALVEQAVELVQRIRKETLWGQLDPGYCSAALSRVEDQLPQRFANLRHVVVGGSTTSRSVLQALYEKFDVAEPQVTLVYRTHQGGQMKLLRKAVGRGRRVRVNSYDEAAVRSAILDADVVHFGIDRNEAVLDRAALDDARDFTERPLWVLDFNTAGSTRDIATRPGVHLWNAVQLDAEVDCFADALCHKEHFPQIVQETEDWIEEQAPTPAPLSLELPCESRDENGHPSCLRCGRSLEQSAAGSLR
jgi:glutamyl-tRNA reductase